MEVFTKKMELRAAGALQLREMVGGRRRRAQKRVAIIHDRGNDYKMSMIVNDIRARLFPRSLNFI